MPIPLDLVVKLGWKSLSPSSTGMPLPLSITLTIAFFSVVSRLMLIFPFLSSGMACMAFFTRLMKTLDNCSRSASTMAGTVFEKVVWISISSVLWNSFEILMIFSFRSTSSLFVLGIFAKFENSVAMADRWSICSMSVCVIRFRFCFSLAASSPEDRCRCCTLSFIGVSGFLISWAICLAISRQADSRSERASLSAESANSSTIWLYALTSAPISSLASYCIFSLLFPKRIFPNLLSIILSGWVIWFEMKTAIRMEMVISRT